jgi:hypothetical protein
VKLPTARVENYSTGGTRGAATEALMKLGGVCCDGFGDEPERAGSVGIDVSAGE